MSGMSSSAFTALAIVLLPVAACWYAVTHRHKDRSAWNAFFVFLGAWWVASLTATLLEQLVAPGGLAHDLIRSGAVAAGVAIGVRTVCYVQPLRTLAPDTPGLRHTKRVSALVIALIFTLLPLITALTLISHFGDYPANHMREAGGALPDALAELYAFYPVFIVVAFWAFIPLYFVVERCVVRWTLTHRQAIGFVALTTLGFALPYAVLLNVLAFDIMELDFPAHLQTTYIGIFMLEMPAAGAVIAALIILVASLFMRWRRNHVPAG